MPVVDLSKHPHPYEDHPARPGDCHLCAAGADDRIHVVKSPFDPNPRKLEPAQNGFVWCDTCDQAQPAAGHECATGIDREDLAIRMGSRAVGLWREARERAEFAESLLCALAWDHGTAIARAWLACFPAECVFCDAARGGGR